MTKVPAILSVTMLGMFALGCASTDAVPEPPQDGVQTDSAKTTEAAGTEEKKAAVLSSYQAPKDKLICTREKTTGSRIPKRICMTVYEREARRENDQRMLQDSHSSGMTAPPGL